MNKLAAYWITIAHLPKWGYKKINNLIKDIYVTNSSAWEEFFTLKPQDWEGIYQLTPDDVTVLTKAKEELSSNSFLAESLYNQGYEIIPINSEEYSPVLKQNLKLTHSPPILYVKGNKQILKEKSVAVVGSRNASQIALNFTDNIVKNATRDYKVIVSGFAKGVDKAALESALKYQGQSIIVLPQGILTFGSGFKTYYKQIINGDVLVLSVFQPKVPWKAELAMARNPIIYGLAAEIFVAESSDKGGTWSGVQDGLRKERVIFVRQPESGEKTANQKLIELGALPVDLEGNLLSPQDKYQPPKPYRIADNDFQEQVKSIISEKALTVKEICQQLECPWSSQKMSAYLKNLDDVVVIKKDKRNKYKLKTTTEAEQLEIFDL